MYNVTIITGASSNHYKTLLQFLNNLKEHVQNYNKVVYNLGFTNKEWDNIKNLNYPNTIYKIFDYSLYPSYFNININAGEYAWKPIIIYNETKNNKGIIMWCDSGTLFNNNLIELFNFVKINNIYTPLSSGNIKKWTHPKTIEYLKIPNNYLTNHNIAAGFCIFNCDIDWIHELIKEWNNYALTKECIAPEGATRYNHRQDQSILTYLYYKYMDIYNFKTNELLIKNFCIQKDIN